MKSLRFLGSNVTFSRLLYNFTVSRFSAAYQLSTSCAVCGQQNEMLKAFNDTEVQDQLDGLSINKAAKSYLEKVRSHEKFMSAKVAEFEIGRRHLANMMGMDPETFTQEDINEALAYLLPSGLHEPRARPQMLPPDKVFSDQKSAQFDMTGRPHHPLFYTLKPHFYQTMHEITGHVLALDKHEDEMLRQTSPVEIVDRLILHGSEWLTKEKLEAQFLESLRDDMYEKFILAMERLCDHPYSFKVKDFIMKFRKSVEVVSRIQELPKVHTDSSGRRYVLSEGTRKTSRAAVKVIEGGTGQFNINGKGIHYFYEPQQREQVLLPLLVCGLVDKVDVVARVEEGGLTGQSGAIRYAIATALQPLVDDLVREKMRLAGLLTLDRRRVERHRPGLLGARARPRWRKR